MKLQYTILWIDDDPEWVSSVEGSIKDNEEVEFKLLKEETGINAQTLLEENHIDLFLIDKNLNFLRGADVIKKIRWHGELAQVVFYSQDYDDELSSMGEWDGVISVHRSEMREKAQALIKGFVERSKNIALMRGMIIAESIDIENQLAEIIKKTFGDKSDLFQERVLDARMLNFSEKWKFVQGYLNDKIKKGKENQLDESLQELRNCKNALDDLDKEVIHQRNILAHSKAEFDGNGKLKLRRLNHSTKDINFNDGWKIKVRGNIKKHHGNLNRILKLIP
ncbi:MAG: hypothetical protein ACR2NQ_02185 [Thermodesulfobacteriota bacterium]